VDRGEVEGAPTRHWRTRPVDFPDPARQRRDARPRRTTGRAGRGAG
jgi:hypothetical protein